MAFYKDNYDVIVIGGALAGMSCAMRLASGGSPYSCWSGTTFRAESPRVLCAAELRWRQPCMK